MKFILLCIASIVSALNSSTLAVGEYAQPEEGDIRSPCPAFNTLANHGYFPRNGSAIAHKDIVQHFHEILGADKAMVKFQLFGSRVSDPVSLFQLQKHGVVEHDVSMFRNDVYFGDNHSVNQTLVEQLLQFAEKSEDKKTLTLDDLADFHKARYMDSKSNNPTMRYKIKEQILAFTEAALLYKIVGGKAGKLNVDQVKAFIVDERLPYAEGWEKGRMTLWDFQFISNVIKVKAAQNMRVEIVKVGFANDDGEEFQADCTVTLVEAGGFRILFDTGGSWDVKSLDTISHITHVVCSHGHSDHVGCLSLFPDAVQVVGRDVNLKSSYRPAALPPRDKTVGAEILRICDGVRVVTTPGHTGHCVSLLLEGEIYFQPQSVSKIAIVGDLWESKDDEGVWQSLSEDPDLQIQSRQFVLNWHPNVIIPGHGPAFHVN